MLLTSPDSFTHYLIGSSALAWDNGVMFEHEATYASEHRDLPARVFMSAGAEERGPMLPNVLRLAETFRSRNYPGLALERHIFDDATHNSVVGVMLNRGLMFLFGNR